MSISQLRMGSGKGAAGPFPSSATFIPNVLVWTHSCSNSTSVYRTKPSGDAVVCKYLPEIDGSGDRRSEIEIGAMSFAFFAREGARQIDSPALCAGLATHIK